MRVKGEKESRLKVELDSFFAFLWSKLEIKCSHYIQTELSTQISYFETQSNYSGWSDIFLTVASSECVERASEYSCQKIARETTQL